ncbi:hypothetical protein [Spongiactinospora sp. 9N601]|uniref:hypothetical protein n=1 Tax=Spongiactinospora sp. 9N601 TaxID=3375149 RepID=UPI003797A548
MSKADCGCGGGCGGCGGLPGGPAAFVRPRFFAGQLLTEDDLSQLVEYVTGKSRLRNRTLAGPGVVCGLEVSCDPCGGGTVVVRPGHALDCRGNDIVLSCTEKVDVRALVRELRVSSLGVDCSDACDDDQRRYGLYVRYEETPVDPVAPYATEEPCPAPGCVPSRIQEGFRFVVKCDESEDHRYNPVTRLLAAVGDRDRYEPVRVLGQRFGLYVDALFAAGAAGARPIEFTADDAARYARSLAWLGESGEGPVTSPQVAREMTEHVRALASALARYDTYDAAGQERLRGEHDLGDVQAARGALGTACERLAATDPEQVWPDRAHRAAAVAVVAEAAARVVTPDPEAPLEVRLLAQGVPVSNVLQAEFRADIVRLREWLLNRLDRTPGLADCALRDDVRKTPIPHPLPTPEPDPSQRLTIAELDHIADAAGRLTVYVRRFVADAACSTLNPPCTNCSDTDVLLAHLELDGCDVTRVCAATREQVLPGGSAYGEWLPKLYQLRHLAQQVCCVPVPVPRRPSVPAEGPVRRPYVAGLLGDWPRGGPLDDMWDLLVTPAPGETVPQPLHERVYTVPSEVTDGLQELGTLRAQVSDLTASLTALRAQLDAAREQVTQVREELPERLGDRLADLESSEGGTQPRRTRSSSTRKPRSGESS